MDPGGPQAQHDLGSLPSAPVMPQSHAVIAETDNEFGSMHCVSDSACQLPHPVPSFSQIGLRQWDPERLCRHNCMQSPCLQQLIVQGQHGESRALLLLKSLSQASLASSVERHSSEESETIVCSLLASPEREEASSASPVK